MTGPAVAATAALLLAACGGKTAAGPAAPKRDDMKPRVVLPATQLYILEATGIAPADTMVSFLSGTRRTIVLRHGPPDNTVFVELFFPADAFPVPKDSLVPRDSVRLELHPRPGQYGLDVTMSATPERGATIRFKYPVHFGAPVAAIERYGTRGRYERALMVGIRMDSTSFGLFESERPASDNLVAPFLGSGTYLVAAPR
jgi:hypothetical protein